MSQVYSTEPSPTGRVILTTTHGPIDIHLFCKECPTTTRCFVQLCLDGYYDNMIFHRILPEFLIQTGLTRGASQEADHPKKVNAYLRHSSAVAPSSSGDGLGWERKGLELNPRIRFNHRGQIAAAVPLKDAAMEDDESILLRYQFFVTLDESPFLDGAHVIFGTIAGPTIFNALRIGKTDVNEATGTPVDMLDAPPRIVSVKVDYHPFSDLVLTPEGKLPWKIQSDGSKGQTTHVEQRRKKRKGKRDFNVLSFGEEEREYDRMVKTNGGGIQSSHDVLHDESAFKTESKNDRTVQESTIQKNDRTVQESTIQKDDRVQESTIQKDDRTVQESTIQKDDRVQESTIQKDDRTVQESTIQKDDRVQESTIQKDDRTVHKSTVKPPHQSNKSKFTGAVQARRAKFLQGGGTSHVRKNDRLQRENETMEKWMAFRTKVLETKGTSSKPTQSDSMADDSLASRMVKRDEKAREEDDRIHNERQDVMSAPGYHGQVHEGSDSEEATDNWMGTTFQCKRHVDHDSRTSAMEGGDGRHMDDYLVVDEKKHGNKGSSHPSKHGHWNNNKSRKYM